MALDLSSLNIRDLATSAEDTKKVIELDLTLVEEDPEQPRTLFLQKELDEMADSIRERGVKSPISVRENPNEPGKYIINHGARRYRASILAAKNTIPAIIDNDYTFVDQIIENLQRQDLEAMEMCRAINKLLFNGMKKQEVAKALGVSNAYVSQYSNLANLPEILQKAFDNKKIEDVTVVNELMTLRKKNPNEVAKIDKWIDKHELITRPLVKQLRKLIETEQNKPEVIEPDNLVEPDDQEEELSITIEDTPEIQRVAKNTIKDAEVEEVTEGELESLFLKPNYDHITASTSVVIEISKEQSAAVLWAYDHGIESLDDDARRSLEEVINSIKYEIWP